jgi:hypothetical protein
MSDDELLGYGVPAEWLNDIKKSTEETLLALTDHLPASTRSTTGGGGGGGGRRLGENSGRSQARWFGRP